MVYTECRNSLKKKNPSCCSPDKSTTTLRKVKGHSDTIYFLLVELSWYNSILRLLTTGAPLTNCMYHLKIKKETFLLYNKCTHTRTIFIPRIAKQKLIIKPTGIVSCKLSKHEHHGKKTSHQLFLFCCFRDSSYVLIIVSKNSVPHYIERHILQTIITHSTYVELLATQQSQKKKKSTLLLHKKTWSLLVLKQKGS